MEYFFKEGINNSFYIGHFMEDTQDSSRSCRCEEDIYGGLGNVKSFESYDSLTDIQKIYILWGNNNLFTVSKHSIPRNFD